MTALAVFCLLGPLALADSPQQDKAKASAAAKRASSLAKAVQAFTSDLSKQLTDKSAATADKNLIFSPFSISAALAVTWAGARGKTAEELAHLLHFTSPSNEIDNSVAEAMGRLCAPSNPKPISSEPFSAFELHVINRLWAQSGEPARPEFLDLISLCYAADMFQVDFASPTVAAATINEWASQKTHGRFKELVDREAVANASLVLTNAVYFNARWEFAFRENLTKPAMFTLLSGSRVNVPMMHCTATLGYFNQPNCKILELPYKDSSVSMLVFVPNAGKFVEFEKSLAAGSFDWTGKPLPQRDVRLAMPKFELSSRIDLKQTMKGLGLDVACTPAADFSGISARADALFISDVAHSAFIKVDETGTEAAAATELRALGYADEPKKPSELIIDRPFIFVVRETTAGLPLFFGRVLDPTSR